jgi:hypothetical protein
LQEQLADMSLQRDQALERGDSALQRVHTLTQANNNADRMIGQLVQERVKSEDDEACGYQYLRQIQ